MHRRLIGCDYPLRTRYGMLLGTMARKVSEGLADAILEAAGEEEESAVETVRDAVSGTIAGVKLVAKSLWK